MSVPVSRVYLRACVCVSVLLCVCVCEFCSVSISCISERVCAYVHEYGSECPYLSMFLRVSTSVSLVVSVCRCVSV